VLEGRTSSIVHSNIVVIEQSVATIDVMGKTNVKYQVEICIALVSQHGVQGTIEEFRSNINLHNNEERDKFVSYQPTILLDQDANDGNQFMFLESSQSPKMVQNWSSITHLHL
jgi:hypothetical protein